MKQGKVTQEEEEDAEEHGEEGEVKPPTREEAFQRQVSISDHTFLKFFLPSVPLFAGDGAFCDDSIEADPRVCNGLKAHWVDHTKMRVIRPGNISVQMQFLRIS